MPSFGREVLSPDTRCPRPFYTLVTRCAGLGRISASKEAEALSRHDARHVASASSTGGGDPEREIETEYIAPDLLPGRDDVTMDIEAMWRDEAPRRGTGAGNPFLQPGVLPGIIGRIGKEAASRPVLEIRCVFVQGTPTAAHCIEQQSRGTPTAWSGQILVSTRGGQADKVLERLKKWIGEELTPRMPDARTRNSSSQPPINPDRPARRESQSTPHQVKLNRRTKHRAAVKFQRRRLPTRSPIRILRPER